MEIIIKSLNNATKGVDFRALLNTNFENIKNILAGVDLEIVSSVIYTDALIDSTDNYAENTVQICCNNSGVVIKQIIDSTWQTMCEYKPSGSGYITFEFPESGLGYPLVNKDETLEGLPVGYIEGVKTVAGTLQDSSDPVHAVGWYKGGQLTKTGRIQLDQAMTAGLPVYVLNGGGWTIEKPVKSGDLVQVIGFISDDGLFIDIDIQPWCII